MNGSPGLIYMEAVSQADGTGSLTLRRRRLRPRRTRRRRPRPHRLGHRLGQRHDGVVHGRRRRELLLTAANAGARVVGGGTDLLDGEPITFGGVNAPVSRPTGIVGSANGAARALFDEVDGSEVVKVSNVGADPIIVGRSLGASGTDPCAGLFVTRMSSDLATQRWSTRLCTSDVRSVDAVVVEGDEVLVLFFTAGPVAVGGQVIIGSGGIIGGALDVDTGAVHDLRNAIVEPIPTTAPAEAPFGAVGFVCGEQACAIAAHRLR